MYHVADTYGLDDRSQKRAAPYRDDFTPAPQQHQFPPSHQQQNRFSDGAPYEGDYHDPSYSPSPYKEQFSPAPEQSHFAPAPYRDNPSNAYLVTPAARKKKKPVSMWIKVGIPLLVLVIAGGVVAAIIAIRKHKDSTPAASSDSGNSTSPAAGGGNKQFALFPTATDSYFLPVYPSTTNAALYVAPTFAASATAQWPKETFVPAKPDPKSVRKDRPRLIAPAYKWQALPDLIKGDPYLAFFHEHIIQNATVYQSLPAVAYVVDGDSGILDVSRQVKQRLKAFAYVYRMDGQDSKWLDAAWKELKNAMGNGDQPFGKPGDLWNRGHFLDVAEMTAAFAIAYDWLYDAWSDTQRSQILQAIITNGLQVGIAEYAANAWWSGGKPGTVVSGNWNCVCNGGLTMGALAIIGDETGTTSASQILDLTIPNALKNCVFGPSTDGSWTETPNYWYFGTTGHAEFTASLISAAGSDFGLLQPAFNLTALYHMYVFGMTSLFDYADHGPNKYSTTANAMMFYSSAFKMPAYMLFQRDRFDAPEPWAMFWYDPAVRGAWWNGLPLDHEFADPETYWASMRSSWTDNTGLYIAMKSSALQGHQTHGDLDCGDFVLDALGQRWAGELGSGDYLSTGYFSSGEGDDSQRWLYYRKRTEGQNTIMIGGQNQLAAEAKPTVKFGSSQTAQGSSTVFSVPKDSTAFFTTDMSTAYGGANSVQRGIRTINGRTQVLLQDDITATAAIQWRMHTNATVNIDSAGTTATLSLGGQTLTATILPGATGAKFTTQDPVRLPTDPPLPAKQVDQPNPKVTVLTIALAAGRYSVQVLFNPQWNVVGATDVFVTPVSVPVDQWSLTSHQ